ncbi:glycoside hydrolase family 3 N-terminal domain-containing protein [Thalassobius sp. Cn5-15]|uniref:glycoside hydrolase family 3 N-terminal domain-containing protein n=1 Tax=Thalassobius sp. Cn5-15 TaxID=2917763 RepID=UPI001EF30383|nr:glycoside hydrolase family 3 N-terminal domain-containing protein [Thalassobius sp. Cn5-15]MCG7492723.1 beta-hexosaminidase [Thalassobius sp. Cn5-15]
MSRYGATVLDPVGPVLSAEEKAFFRDSDPFAFILFARHIEHGEQLRRLCGDLREAVGREALITIDQEGGRVQRLVPPMATQFLPPLEEVVQAGEHATSAMLLRYRIIAHELRSYGIDSNCAPCADVAGPETHPFLQNRCYGMEEQTVTNVSRAVVNGLLAGGVVPVLKHMPGHGRAISDSHFETPRVRASLPELQQDFAPFRALNDVPMGMTAHVQMDALDDQPATLSAAAMEYIRNDIGFDGLIMTDDCSMQALPGSRADVAERAIAAGVDAVLYCNGALADKVKVAEAAGQMSEAAQARAEMAIAARITPENVDIAELKAKHNALLNRA